jgi:hypothetical protein
MKDIKRTPMTEEEITLAADHLGDLLWLKLYCQKRYLTKDEKCRLNGGIVYDMSIGYNVYEFKKELISLKNYREHNVKVLELKAINWLAQDVKDINGKIDFELPAASLILGDYWGPGQDIHLVYRLHPVVHEEQGVRVSKICYDPVKTPEGGLHTRIPMLPLDTIIYTYDNYLAIMDMRSEGVMD